MPPLQPLFGPITELPQSQLDKKLPRRTLFLNNFQPSSWFLLAASLQGLITWLFPTALTFIPAILGLAYRSIDVVLQIYGFKANPAMDGVITKKISAQLPDGNGGFGDKPSRDSVVVLLLGAKSNHPLGILYPAFGKMAEYLNAMVRELEANREEYGFLTSTSWLSNSDATLNAARGGMTIYYFRNMAGVHKFAHGPLHRAGWDWWNRTAKEHPDISIMHEVYEAAPGKWENVYMNYKPTGLATAVVELSGSEKEGGEKKWVGSIVDANKVNMKNAKARLGGGIVEGEGDGY
ncbi:hypothetical protein BDV06DRAFT_233856 [Aspergillus oleicola]